MKNESGFQIWDDRHEFVRWALYIPAVFILSFGFAFLFNLVSLSRGDFEGIFLYLQAPVNAGLSSAIFVWLSLNLAPRNPKICAWTIFILWSPLLWLTFARVFYIIFVADDLQIKKEDVVELLQSGAWLVVGFICLVRMGQKFNKELLPSNGI